LAEDGGLGRLLDGDKAAWDAFVRRYAGLIVAAVRGVATAGGDSAQRQRAGRRIQSHGLAAAIDRESG